ncbi:MAG: site-specific integrase [Muribaculaceae bacterium]|nr:site-specific integrase [Muribaculaceae bacterium]
MEIYPKVKIVHGRRFSSVDSSLSPVEIEIYYQRKRKWISTGIKARKENWNNTKMIVGRADAFDANMVIENLYNTVTTFIRKLVIDKKPFTWSALNLLIENRDNEQSFIKFVKDLVVSRKDITDSTRRNHKKFSVALEEFGLILEFKDINSKNIQLYDRWLHKRKDYKQSTIASYHKYMKVYINEALRLELISRNPYESIKIDQGKPGVRKYLNPEELASIESCNIPSKSIAKVKDMFIFQCYTGLAYSDLKKFDFHLVEQRGQRYILHDVRKKTEQDYYIVLLPPAMEILRKYDYVLPIMSNEQYNMRLKVVAEYAGINKNLTSHMGRHTFATLSLNSGIKIEVLAQMMGHTDIRTTQIYAKMINCTVEEAYGVLEANENVKSLIGYLNEVFEAILLIIGSSVDV